MPDEPTNWRDEMNAKQKCDMYSFVTDKALELMEIHGSGWVKPWADMSKGGYPHNAVTGNCYRGTNVFWLLLSAMANDFTSNTWATFKQWRSIGATVRKGERAEYVSFFKNRTIKEWNDDEGEYDIKQIPLLRAYPVFNADQVDGYLQEAYPPEVDDPNLHRHGADLWIESIDAKSRVGDKACYIPGIDTIVMPPFDAFYTPEDYYSTYFHEIGHWTKHEDRCNRNLSGRFGDEAYALEELVAELASAFQCVYLGISHEPREDHAKYLNCWMKRLRNDKKAFFTAASKAQEAVDYLDGIVDWHDDDEDEVPYTDRENVYGLPGIQQSIEEDRK